MEVVEDMIQIKKSIGSMGYGKSHFRVVEGGRWVRDSQMSTF